MICYHDPKDGLNIGKAVAEYRATILIGTSIFFRLCTRNKQIHPLIFESLRLIIVGAEKLSTDVQKAFKLKFNKNIYEAYGATEISSIASGNLPDYMDTTYWNIQTGSKTGTVGLPHSRHQHSNYRP